MKRLKHWHYLLLAAAVVFGAIGTDQGLRAAAHRRLASESRHLLQSVAAADQIEDPAEAVASYLGIAPQVPELQLRILQRQWVMALQMLQQVERIKSYAALSAEAPEAHGGLEARIEAMLDRCSTLLADAQALRPELRWQAHNLNGCVHLLQAFMALENEGNWKKAGAMLRAAIAALKAAIAAVDQSQAPAHVKNIPRWNLELLYSERYVKMMVRAEGDGHQRLDLKHNLEAIIPEKGGYAPGEPTQRKIRK